MQRVNFFKLWLGVLGFLSSCAAPSDGTVLGGSATGGEGGSGGQGGSETAADAAGDEAGSGGGDSACGQKQHLCGGICTDLPASGCYADPTCTPCPVPENGHATCTAEGSCDFECSTGYRKTGSACACASQCCSPADCEGGQDCNNGVCEPPPEPCNGVVCIAECLLEGKIGICIADTCVCQ